MNIQRGKDGNAKAYQVRQVLADLAASGESIPEHWWQTFGRGAAPTNPRELAVG